MDISSYTSFFHDGSIIDIQHLDDKMIISMESAQIDEADLKDDVVLSKVGTIRGNLHMEKIKQIKEDSVLYKKLLKMKTEDAGIYHFDVCQNKVELHVGWDSPPPNIHMEDFSVLEIEAEKIWWENVPDLVDPSSGSW